MAREYNIIGQNVTVGGAVTLIHVQPASGQTIEITRMWVSQEANATSAQLAIEWGYKATAFPTLTSATPQKLKFGDPASQITGGTAGAAGTSGINASAEGAGATTVIGADNFNALQGWLWTPSMVLGETIQLNSAAARGFYLKFRAAPGTLTGWTFGMTFRELG